MAPDRIPERIPLPRLLSRSWTTWASLGVAFVGALAVLGFYAATDATNRPFAVGLAAVLVVVAVLVLARRRWLEAGSGEVVVQVAGVWRRRWRLAEASAVKLVPNHAGQVLLRIEDPDRRAPFHHALVANDLGGERAQPPQHLRALAEVIERWAPRQRAVVDALRAQADHLEAGGTTSESPLARRHLRSGRPPGTAH